MFLMVQELHPWNWLVMHYQQKTFLNHLEVFTPAGGTTSAGSNRLSTSVLIVAKGL